MKHSIFAVLIALSAACAAFAAEPSSPQTPTESQPVASSEAVAKWQDLKFGIFVHWGPVTLAGTELGHSRGKEVPIEVYDNLYKRFNPVKYNADKIVKLAEDAGAKYIVLIARHHDGFCMFDSKLTDYDIMSTPFARDTVAEMAEACRKRDFPFGIYESVCDWWHPDFPLGSPKGYVRKPNPNMDRYEKYLTAQVEELMTNYGPLLTLWFDWPQEFGKDRGLRILHKIRCLQPDILINDRLAAPMGEAIPGDYDTPEGKVGNMQLNRPWETCMKLGQQWSWKPDDKILPLKNCLHVLVNTVGGGGNLLLNVPPGPDGAIEPEQAERIREIGRWLKKYGESIYETRGGPFERGPWGAATRKGNTIYLHILDPSLDEVKLAPLRRKVIEARVLTGGTATVKNDDMALRVSVPKADRDDIDTIVALKLDGPAEDAVVEPWNMEKLSKPPRILEEHKAGEIGVKQISFEGLPIFGKQNRVLAYYGVPEVAPDKTIPAVVLVSCGLDERLDSWVRTWMNYGYAAIALQDGGPVEWEFMYNVPLRDQWARQAVADIIMANSFIRSLPEVDSERIGLNGYNEGGYLACIAAGVDKRFRFAVPIYGCGFLDADTFFANKILENSPVEYNYWLGLWDPAIYLRDVKMPMLWVSCTNDPVFPLDSFQQSSRLPQGDRTLSVRVGTIQNIKKAARVKEIRVFANSILRNGDPLPEVSIRRRMGLKAGVNFHGKTAIKKVELNYTEDTGPWKDRKWQTIEPTVDFAAGVATGTLPEGATAYFFNVTDSRGLVVSTDHFNVPRSVSMPKPKKK